MLDDTAKSTGVRDNIFYHMLGEGKLSAASLCTLAGMTGVEVFVDYLGPYTEPGVFQDTFDVQLNVDLGIDRGLYTVLLSGLGVWDEETSVYLQARRLKDPDKITSRLRETVLLDFKVCSMLFEPYLTLDRIQATAEKIKAIALIGQRYSLVAQQFRAIFKELK